MFHGAVAQLGRAPALQAGRRKRHMTESVKISGSSDALSDIPRPLEPTAQVGVVTDACIPEMPQQVSSKK